MLLGEIKGEFCFQAAGGTAAALERHRAYPVPLNFSNDPFGLTPQMKSSDSRRLTMFEKKKARLRIRALKLRLYPAGR